MSFTSNPLTALVKFIVYVILVQLVGLVDGFGIIVTVGFVWSILLNEILPVLTFPTASRMATSKLV
jgi:hypothetical protein